VSKSVNVPKLAFAVEDFLRPFAGDTELFGKGAEEFDDLRDVVIVFAVLGAGLGIEEVVACDKFEDLWNNLVFIHPRLLKTWSSDIPYTPYSKHPYSHPTSRRE
jgi:hypothetical protein